MTVSKTVHGGSNPSSPAGRLYILGCTAFFCCGRLFFGAAVGFRDYFSEYLCHYFCLHLGEICALKWKDIDLKRETVHVGHTIQRIPLIGENVEKKTSVILDRPKSDASQRTIPLPGM